MERLRMELEQNYRSTAAELRETTAEQQKD